MFMFHLFKEAANTVADTDMALVVILEVVVMALLVRREVMVLVAAAVKDPGVEKAPC